MSDKIPFGFRQDVEIDPEPGDKPEPEHKEINVTSASTERSWQPHMRAPAQAKAEGGCRDDHS